ncbi:DUF928 domain-containing protein [Alkalinema pantanalense CENA528]|uniref:DUF928 domain-containing protein n=1 Tax=Alkalinema pantanalense TaxID=1620705 RepID=UPI003D6FD5DE
MAKLLQHWRQSSCNRRFLSVGMVLLLTGLNVGVYTPPSTAQSVPERLWRLLTGQSRRADNNRPRGAASRGGCRSDQPLMALVPMLREGQETPLFVGSTTEAYPTFWFYLPYPLTPAHSAELRVEEPDPEDERYTVQRTVLTLQQAQPGIIHLQLPKTESPLAINQLVHWKFVVKCDEKDTSMNQFVDFAMIRLKTDPTLFQEILLKPPIERSKRYLQAGIWNDALTTLGALRLQQPQNSAVEKEWHSLLKTAGLEDVATQPLNSCCQVPLREKL